MRNRRHKKKNKQVVHIPLSAVADSPKKKKGASASISEVRIQQEVLLAAVYSVSVIIVGARKG